VTELRRMSELPDESIEVPQCDCPATYVGEKLHQRACPRMAAIIRKWHGVDAEQRYLRGERA